MKILSILPANKEQEQKLKLTAQKYNADIFFEDRHKVTEEQVLSADIILGNAPVQFVAKSRRLKWLQTNSAGTDQFIVPGVLPAGVLLTNATGSYGPSVGGWMFAQTLSLLNKLYLYRDAQRESRWTDFGKVEQLAGKTVLICGAGDIGLYYAKCCKQMGACTIGIKRRPSEKADVLDELYLSDEIEKVLPRADIVASVLPGTKDTYQFFDSRKFSCFKNGSYFINAGRGTSVEQKILAQMLQSGKLEAAAIDVTDPEPLPEDSPLWKIPNLVISPHVAGGFHLDETVERIVNIALENLENYFSGKILRNIVDFETGYKK
jgi:phosphoglycerate dehydrogenase-like enzyme